MSIRAVLLLLLISALSVASIRALADEHGGGHEEAASSHESSGHGEGEKKAEGGEHGGGHGGEEKSALAPWVEIENKIQELYAKIKSKESTVLQLLEEKDHLADNSPHLKQTVKEIVREHKELRQLVENYEKNVSLLKYRFPERNAKHLRTYDRFEVKSIDDMEKALGIDGKLSRNMKKVRSLYNSEEKQAVREPSSVAPAVTQKKEPSIEEAHSIILQK